MPQGNANESSSVRSGIISASLLFQKLLRNETIETARAGRIGIEIGANAAIV
jgi:hypothetical protein